MIKDVTYQEDTMISSLNISNNVSPQIYKTELTKLWEINMPTTVKGD